MRILIALLLMTSFAWADMNVSYQSETTTQYVSSDQATEYPHGDVSIRWDVSEFSDGAILQCIVFWQGEYIGLNGFEYHTATGDGALKVSPAYFPEYHRSYHYPDTQHFEQIHLFLNCEGDETGSLYSPLRMWETRRFDYSDFTTANTMVITLTGAYGSVEYALSETDIAVMRETVLEYDNMQQHDSANIADVSVN